MVGQDAISHDNSESVSMMAPDTSPPHFAGHRSADVAPRRRAAARTQIATIDEEWTVEDGWRNIESSLGMEGADSGTATHFGPRAPLSGWELETLYRQEGLARKLIDLKVSDMFRRLFEVKGDKEGLFVKYLKKRKMITEVRRLATNGRLYGGAVALIIANDGTEELSKPMNVRNLRSLDGLKVWDRWQVTWTVADLYTNPNSPKYLTPKVYTIYPIYATPFRVHETRLLRYDGNYLPERPRMQNTGWGDSILEGPYLKLKSMCEAMGWSSAIIRDFILGVFAMDNVSEHVAEGNEKVILDRLKIMRRWKSGLNFLLLDKDGETYEKKASTVTGLDKLLTMFMQWFVSDTEYSFEQLFEKMSGSMGTGKEMNEKMSAYLAGVSDEQEEKLDPVFERLLFLVQNCKAGPFKGQVDEEMEIDWLPPRAMSQKEIAEIRKSNSEADVAYIDRGVYTPAEVARTRSGAGGDFQVIEMDFDRTKSTELDLEEEETEPAGGAPAKKGKAKAK